MRRRLLFWMVPWLVIGTGACTTFQPPKPPSLDVAKACAEWRWIGISRSGSQCPEIPGWTVRPLFPQLALAEEDDKRACSADPEVTNLKMIRELNRFCVYETAPSKGWMRRSPPPPVSAKLVRIDQDCAAIAPTGSREAVLQKRESYSSRFSEQVGKKSFVVHNPDGVRLAFLDTEPTGGIVSERRGRSPHGYTLARIAQSLLCDPHEGCAARITTRLALPIISFDSRHPGASQIDDQCGDGRKCGGGYIGLQSHIARAIRDEVDDWRQERHEGSEQHLVLNLSLAWDGEIFGGLGEKEVADMRAGTQAVYRALEYAAGFDVLVLAAAGNQKGAPCASFGPLLPAAWERGGPQEESCGSKRPPPPPLVYAVGGVQSDGGALVNARQHGMPLRAAYGENAPVPAMKPDQLYILTGSSVSTAVVSSIAAAVWSSFPRLTARQVMETLDDSGEELSLKADFWPPENASIPGSSSHGVHRLSLCTALEAAWKKWGTSSGYASCPVQLPCDSWKNAASLFVPKRWVADSCQPWAYPQPESPLCLSCGPPQRSQ